MNDPERFRIVFRKKQTEIPEPEEQLLKVYAGTGRHLIVENGRGQELTVYTLTGAALVRYRIDNDKWISPRTFETGVYVVRCGNEGFKVMVR
jgi:hypothetical protein